MTAQQTHDTVLGQLGRVRQLDADLSTAAPAYVLVERIAGMAGLLTRQLPAADPATRTKLLQATDSLLAAAEAIAAGDGA